MVYKDLSPERKAEYRRRIEKIKKAHPDKFYPSEYHSRIVGAYAITMENMLRFYKQFEAAAWPFILWDEVPPRVRKVASLSLSHTAAMGDKGLCEALWTELGADVDFKDKEGNTALLKAVERKRLGVAEWLLDRGAKISSNKSGWNPVLLACYMGCVPALNMFHHHGIDFNHPYTQWGWKKGIPYKKLCYPIQAAVFSDQPKAPQAVQWLIDHGVSIDTKGSAYASVRKVFQNNSPFLRPEIKEILMQTVNKTPVSKQNLSNIPSKSVQSTCRR